VSDRIHFGPFEADVEAGRLRRDGALVPVQDLPFRLLAALLERPGEVMTRAELSTRLWGLDTFVDSAAGLNTAVAKLREALGDQAEQPLYIETIPKRGYRFVGQVTNLASVTAVAQNGNVAQDANVAHAASVAQDVSPAIRKRRWMMLGAVVAIAVVAVAAYQLRASRPQTRVAVILFDNETGRPEVSRLSQALTDATVFALTADPKLAVIGNAAVLRTERPFRDIALVRDTVHADFIIIGQVQTVDDRILVRSHLIRAADEAHVWVKATRMTADEATLQSDVSTRIAEAVSSRAGAK
jgi:DNA-binding winged helix-turn-helix (wHTH) protein/TolB-like protein